MKPKRPEDLEFLSEVGRPVPAEPPVSGPHAGRAGSPGGLSRSFVGIFETGTHGIDVLSLRRIAQALGVPLAELVDERPPNARPNGGF